MQEMCAWTLVVLIVRVTLKLKESCEILFYWGNSNLLTLLSFIVIAYQICILNTDFKSISISCTTRGNLGPEQTNFAIALIKFYRNV
jgi:hypothetical protein